MTTLLTTELTPEQENETVTKSDLSLKFKIFGDRVFEKFTTKQDLIDMEQRLDDKMTAKMDKILTAVDGIATQFNNHKEQHDMNQAAHDRFDARITKLEGNPIAA